MKIFLKVIKFIFYFFLIILAAAIHLSINSFLPPPFNNTNIFLLIAVLLLVTKPTGKSLLFLLTIALLIETYSALPFGILLSAFFVAGLTTQWTLLNFFTDRSIFIVALIGIMTIIIYRFCFFLFWLIYNFFVKANLNLNIELIKNVGWEIILTTAGLIFVYSLITFAGKKLRPEYIHMKNQDIYGRKKTFI